MGRYFLSVTPSPEDIARASQLPLSTCPRRYCWWWRSLAFEWDVPVVEGCTYFDSPKPSHWLDTDKPCCRCDSNSVIDHYEPREPHLEQDGFDRYRFCGTQQQLPDGDYDLVIETFTDICQRYEKFGFDNLTEPERVIFCTWQFVCEVNNGGIHQFFNNPSGEFAVETVFALEQVQMPHAASLLRRALAAFPRPDKNHETRASQLGALPANIQDDLFNKLTTDFFDSPEDPYALQADFVRRNQKDFPKS